MRCELLTLFIGIICHTLSFAQPGKSVNFASQVSFTTENDRYLFQGNDRYYTNGIMLDFSYVKHPANKKNLKRINEFEIGQKLYTPHSRRVYAPRQVDRAITGYLYGKYTQSNFRLNNQMISWGVSVGTIGEAALGRQMQNLFHDLIHVNSDWYGWIWDYQLNNEPGINLHGTYAKGFLRDQLNWIQLTPITKAIAGTSVSNASQGILLQAGKMNKLDQSSYFNSLMETKSNPVGLDLELYAYYYPEVMYQFYNATVEGGMFRKDKGPFASGIMPWVLTHKIGAAFAMSRYTIRVEVTMLSKESRKQRYTHNYGGLEFAYRFN